jgi:hypothetical protein
VDEPVVESRLLKTMAASGISEDGQEMAYVLVVETMLRLLVRSMQ